MIQTLILSSPTRLCTYFMKYEHILLCMFYMAISWCSNYMNFLVKSMNKIISLHEHLENLSGNTDA